MLPRVRKVASLRRLFHFLLSSSHRLVLPSTTTISHRALKGVRTYNKQYCMMQLIIMIATALIENVQFLDPCFLISQVAKS